ncbi:DEAD/DEAH box helicase, partial [Arthrospira platensis SPKY1]|nr:DEAD/DEAH box helicase [Arthrospira platensis SPKY1]
ESLPTYLLDALNLISKAEAIINIHMPKTPEAMLAASFRLKFEELFWIQLQLITKNMIRKHKIKGHPFSQIGTYFNEFYQNHLPFSLTNAQKRVIKEIRKDLGSHAQMNRLLQGDVGSGKTIVAFLCMLMAIDNGFQSCLMAPTEILATQHYRSIAELAEKMNLEVALLTGSTKVSERRRIHEGLINGNIT